MVLHCIYNLFITFLLHLPQYINTTGTSQYKKVEATTDRRCFHMLSFMFVGVLSVSQMFLFTVLSIEANHNHIC